MPHEVGVYNNYRSTYSSEVEVSTHFLLGLEKCILGRCYHALPGHIGIPYLYLREVHVRTYNVHF